jgi:hypothetical protein
MGAAARGVMSAGRAGSAAASAAAAGTAARSMLALGSAGSAGASALAGLAAATGPVGVGLGILAGAAGAAGVAVRTFAGTAAKEAERLKGLSLSLAEERSLTNVRRQMADLRRANEIGPELARFQTTRSKLEDSLSDLGTEILDVLINLANRFEPAIDAFARYVDLVSAIIDFLKPILTEIASHTLGIKAMTGILRNLLIAVEILATSMPAGIGAGVRKGLEEIRKRRALNDTALTDAFLAAGSLPEWLFHPDDLPPLPAAPPLP